jgi:shikimate kinase
MRIYLVGYMGSGKTTLGRRLARLMGLNFIDLDKYIEERHCRTVQQLFAGEGEEIFRRYERKALEEVAEYDDVVVSTGGGAPCFFDNMALMNRTGTTVFLDLPPAILAGRLLRSKTERPLIKGKTPEELRLFIVKTLAERRPYYEKARFTITRSETPAEEIVKLINHP